MASIGLKSFIYSIIKDGKYSGPKKMKGAIESNPTINFAEASLYADDSLAERISEFSNGTVSFVIADDDDTIFAPLLGHTLSEDGEVLKAEDDEAPYVGFARVLTKVVNGVKKYKAEVLLKVKFKDYMASGKTKGDSIEFQTPTIEATIFAIPIKIDGAEKNIWERHQTFDSLTEAEEYINTLFEASKDIVDSYTGTTVSSIKTLSKAKIADVKTTK